MINNKITFSNFEFNDAYERYYNKSTIPSLYSWTSIILMFFFFAPAGLFVLWKRSAYDKKFALGKGIRLICYSSFFIFMFFLVMVFGNGEPAERIVGFSFTTLILSIFILVGVSKHKRLNNYKKYIILISKYNITSFDNIGFQTSIPYETVRRDIAAMIASGFFSGSRISADGNSIVLPNNTPKQQAQFNAPPKPQTKVVDCNSCGAKNTIVVGNANECQFCGTPIS